MSELNKDSVIKLFGKTIPLSAVNDHYQHCQQREILPNENASNSPAHLDDCSDPNLPSSSRDDTSNMEVQELDKENSKKEVIEDKQEDESSQQIRKDLKDPTTSSGISDKAKSPSNDGETSSLKSSNNGEQSETSISQGKTLKKPDKILPCPRCNSMDTKFCYYNNYNVNQPRHFCKNCQRYWTAGGTMRNVPVGAGRRKNKSSSASNYRQIMISEAFRAVQANVANGIHNHNSSFGNNGTVLNFGSDSPLCESVASVLSLSDKRQNCVRNGFNSRPEQRILAPHGGRDNGDDQSSGSSITATNSSDKGRNCSPQEAKNKNYQGFSPPVTYFPGPPWSYPWNSPMPPSTALYPSGFPVSFYPETTYWGCTVPSHWNMPCLSPSSSSMRQYASIPNPNSPNLGKHSRDGNIINPGDSEKEPSGGSNNSERSVLVPKTLRIDDPKEASKSSIWASLGIKSEKTSSGEALFKGFKSKGDDKNYSAETSAVLQANPAALSRSLNFHEST